MAGPLYFLYRGMYLPKFFHTPEAVQHWEEFTFRPNDVTVATYPKSGTNWMLEMVPLVLSGGEPSLVNSMATWDRTAAVGTVQALNMDLENCPSPRIFSTHYYYNILPKSFYQVKPKVIYVMRNPKDVLVSAFYYYGRLEYHTNPGSLKEFLHKFLKGDVPYCNWFDHTKSWLTVEDKSHILYLTYEEMIQDLRQVVSRTAEFLEKPLEEEQIDRISDRCLFNNMKKHITNIPSKFDHSFYFRKGIVGDWKNHLAEEDAQYFDTVYKEKMKDIDFKFRWD